MNNLDVVASSGAKASIETVNISGPESLWEVSAKIKNKEIKRLEAENALLKEQNSNLGKELAVAKAEISKLIEDIDDIYQDLAGESI